MTDKNLELLHYEDGLPRLELEVKDDNTLTIYLSGPVHGDSVNLVPEEVQQLIDFLKIHYPEMIESDILHKILSWCNAYPLDIFPKPDMKLARKALEKAGITLDSVSASNMRHVLAGIKKLIEENR